MTNEFQVTSATEKMKQRWADLAVEIADAGPVAPSCAVGELTVLGSGICHADVMIADEAIIRRADHVFHCLYDRVTQGWINTIRPDALDMRILYDPAHERYETYVCMAEALLHHVRRGQHVLAVFYGHPGIFATPTHRAVAIARREGHVARMRPGISALDHLVADIGFDPMIPGLLSYEATDLLLRRRRLDPTLHTVLWQVGAVGESGFAPLGFENGGFGLLVAKLMKDYGGEAEVVHYRAPQYAGIEPLIDRFAIAELRAPSVRAAITALSTFYLPPARIEPTHQGNARALGHRLTPDRVERQHDVAGYGSNELTALRRFGAFRPPEHYVSTTATPAADFILALSRDPSLLSRYRADPAAAVAAWDGGALSDRARRLLEIPHPRAFNAAIAEPATDGRHK